MTLTVGSLGSLELLAVVLAALVALVVYVLPFWKICEKAGLPRGLSILILIPVVNLVFLFVLAFSRWPIETELELLRRQAVR